MHLYLPKGMRWANAMGPVADPRVMDWRDALDRLKAAKPTPTEDALVRSLAPEPADARRLPDHPQRELGRAVDEPRPRALGAVAARPRRRPAAGARRRRAPPERAAPEGRAARDVPAAVNARPAAVESRAWWLPPVASLPVSIVIADDHAMVRSGLRVLLDAEPDLSVVAEAGDVAAALECARTHRPAVVVLDLNMPGEPSLPAIPRLLEAAPGDGGRDAHDAGRARVRARGASAGASGYVVKTSAEEDLVRPCGPPPRAGPTSRPRSGRAWPRRCGGRRPRRARATPSPRSARRSPATAIDGVAGRGAMGVVLRATDLVLDRPVALKLIAPISPATRCSARASSASAGSRRRWTTRTSSQIYRAGEEDGRLYVTMRYVDGTDLKALIARERLLEPERAVALLAQVAGGARRRARPRPRPPRRQAREHPRRQRHGAEHAFLTDFGISKQRAETSDTALTGTGMALGSVDYMAPEQAQVRDLDARTDVYALGCVLFHALTGSVPFIRGSDFERMWAHAHEPPPARDVRRAARAARRSTPSLERALAKAQDDRQQSAGQLVREARAALAA